MRLNSIEPAQAGDFIIVESQEDWANLLPVTLTRPCGDIRAGIYTNAERWERFLGGKASWQPVAQYLRGVFPEAQDISEQTLYVDGTVIATEALAHAALALNAGQELRDSAGNFLARRGSGSEVLVFQGDNPLRINRPYHIFSYAGQAIEIDFALQGNSAALSPTNTVVGDRSMIYLAPGAKAECAVFNTTGGPIYVGPDAEIMEGALLRGPIAVCSGASVNMGAKIYGATVIGPHCKVGGEVNNAVMHSYSNKAHDGFLGNAVIGQWCNIGAGAVASNLKNNYTPVKQWNYPSQRFLPTGLQFCGLVMGDHSKAGINTMFNTATVVGVAVNVHQTGFPRNFVPSFSDGGAVSGFTEVSLREFLDTAARVMARRGCSLSPAQAEMFRAIKDEEYRDLL